MTVCIPDESRSQEKSAAYQRARVILEFIEGDFNRRPLIFPEAGSDEADEAIRKEIERRWREG